MLEDRVNLYGFGLIALCGVSAGVMLVQIAGRSATEIDFITTIIWIGVLSVVVALIKIVVMWNRPLDFPAVSVQPDQMLRDDA